MTSTAKLRDELNGKLRDYEAAKQVLHRDKKLLEEAEATEAALVEVQDLLQRTAQAIQTTAHARIAGLVTEALKSIFDDAPEFKIVFERKRGKTEASLVFEKEGHQLSPLDASGGGLVDVAAFALRLAAVLLSKPKRRLLLLLDEPFRFVSKNYLPKVKMLIDRLANDLGVQIIMVTHLSQLEAEANIDLGDVE